MSIIGGLSLFFSFREVVDIHFETLVVGGGGSTSRPGGTCTFRDSSRPGGSDLPPGRHLYSSNMVIQVASCH